MIRRHLDMVFRHEIAPAGIVAKERSAPPAPVRPKPEPAPRPEPVREPLPPPYPLPQPPMC
jgi:hypothetical protein